MLKNSAEAALLIAKKLTVDASSSPPARRARPNGDASANGDLQLRVTDNTVFPARPVAATHPRQSIECCTSGIPSRTAIAAEKVLRSFNTWAFKREQPSNPQLMLQIIADAITLGEPISFVLYWGKGPRCKLADPDTHCLDYLARLAHRVREVHAPGAAIKLIFTDTHAELNGHCPSSAQSYFGMVEVEARQRNFDTCWLSWLTAAAQPEISGDLSEDIVPEDLFRKLSASAAKWFHGDGTSEEAALKYYRSNMVEKQAVEFAFPRSIFITFNGSDLRSLFPAHLPIFYMYSLRRGVSVKPWFFQPVNTTCEDPSCGCNAASSDTARVKTP
jgi:hypothetical protein